MVKIGRWGIGTGRRIFVSARRQVPALHLVLTADFAETLGYGELLISTHDVDQILATLIPVVR